MISSCKSQDKRQGFYPLIYAGDSAEGAIKRGQDNEVISCKDQRFDEMFCMFDRDLENLFKKCMAQVEKENAWYYFGDKKASGTKLEKPKE